MSHSTYLFVSLPLLERNNCCLISHATYYHNKSPVVWYVDHGVKTDSTSIFTYYLCIFTSIDLDTSAIDCESQA